MTKTKINKAIALSCIAVLSASSLLTSGLGTAFAAQIGTGSVDNTTSFDSAIIWDDSFPGTATGTVSGIVIKARVLPTLDMKISTGTIDLGDLVSGVASTGSLFLEVGTNAKAGVTITARSGSGGLTNTSTGAIQINNLVADGLAETYNFSSTVAGTDDSSSPAFSASGLGSTVINNNSTEHTVYTTNKGEATNLINDVEFIVSAQSEAETPAWEYEDTVTFTVVGNF